MKNIYILSFLICMLAACGEKPDYIAEVGKGGITKGQYEAYLASLGKVNASPKVKKELLDNMLEAEILFQQANEETHKQTKNMIDNYRRNTIAKKWLDKKLNNYPESDDIKKFYEAHAEKYTEKYIEIAHILIKWAGKTDGARLKTRNDAVKIYQKLKEGMEFEKLAEEYSDDKISAAKGGCLGFLPVNYNNDIFMNTALKLKASQFSEPIETKLGVHIIKRLNGERNTVKQLKLVKDEIRAFLIEKKKSQLSEQYKKSNKVKINPEKFKSFIDGEE